MTVVPWTRATSGISKSKRVTLSSLPPPLCGPAPVTMVPVTRTAALTTSNTRLIVTMRGVTIGRLSVASSGWPARRYKTIALLSSTIDTRKCAITKPGLRSNSTVRPPSTACAKTPATRPTESHTRSRRRGVRTRLPSTATITAIDTSPVNRRFTNSTIAL